VKQVLLILILQVKENEPGMVVHVCDLSPLQTEAGGPQVQASLSYIVCDPLPNKQQQQQKSKTKNSTKPN
jgi:hypothetical protein